MTERSFTVIENHWITLEDGTRLAARIWMPDNSEADPVPAVFEFLPYRKGDGTSPRDESTYPSFAAAGIAGVRVDIRGSGESEGVIDGEYTPLELANACELIAWIAAQPWCNGSVGMMGISWGGFNCLQVAALRPPALKAIISLASTVDRYNDDIHYKNGCHLSAQLSWAATMLAYQSRSPDPALTGDRWREMWLERLENEPFFLEEWLEHQRRDAFWQHGSVNEAFGRIEIPAMVIAGWADGYRNTPMKAIEGMGSKAKALIGPWIHKYPHFAYPKPRADFLGEAIAWWNRWLRGEETGVEALPQMRAFILDGPRPAIRRDVDPGFWIAKDDWTRAEPHVLHVGSDSRLAEGHPGANAERPVYLRSPLDTGVMAGEYFTVKPDAEMAGDQRLDDAGSLTFETSPLDEAQAFLGEPVLTLRLSTSAPLANLVARIVDVHPDGVATRVSFGVLNLAHRHSNAEPEAMPEGEMVEIRMVLDACGYRFGKGHRIRLSLSTAYWPLLVPPPVDPGVTFDAASLALALPALGEHRLIEVKEPDNPDPLPDYITLTPAISQRGVYRDLTRQRTEYRILEDTGLSEHPQSGFASRECRRETWTIAPDDPLSVTGSCHHTTEARREGWAVRTECRASMRATATDWLISARVSAYEGETLVHEKTWDKRIPRDFM
nr:CocE/NonD family hydrolase [uncultured Gellertiella sp.]